MLIFHLTGWTYSGELNTFYGLTQLTLAWWEPELHLLCSMCEETRSLSPNSAVKSCCDSCPSTHTEKKSRRFCQRCVCVCEIAFVSMCMCFCPEARKRICSFDCTFTGHCNFSPVPQSVSAVLYLNANVSQADGVRNCKTDAICSLC